MGVNIRDVSLGQMEHHGQRAQGMSERGEVEFGK